MSYSYDYAYMVEDGLTAVISALASAIPSGILGIASYVLTALALYTLAQRRGINKPWLSWIPVVNVWVLGSLSDQYRYVVKGENKSKRKILLVLSILSTILTATVFVSLFGMIANLLGGILRGMQEEEAMRTVFGTLLSMAAFALPMAAIAIAQAVIHFMALYDVYTSMDPGNNVLFLVLSILFSVTEPFFLFFNRKKDLGMPPRKQEPVFTQPQWQQTPQWTQSEPQQPIREPWEDTENKDYL